jgi:hypothetical protein
MSLLRQDPKASSTALFTHAGVTPTTDDQIREKVLNFIRDKVRVYLFLSAICKVPRTALHDLIF